MHQYLWKTEIEEVKPLGESFTMPSGEDNMIAANSEDLHVVSTSEPIEEEIYNDGMFAL